MLQYQTDIVIIFSMKWLKKSEISFFKIFYIVSKHPYSRVQSNNVDFHDTYFYYFINKKIKMYNIGLDIAAWKITLNVFLFACYTQTILNLSRENNTQSNLQCTSQTFFVYLEKANLRRLSCNISGCNQLFSLDIGSP